jgi:tRNA-2-methylthio-N6-dimethylallyladenosine synthase
MFKYHLITLGCQMNKSDSERLASLLDNLGLTETAHPEDADFILFNSCSVRQAAEDRIFGQVRNFSKLRKKNQRLVIGVTGCMAGRDADGQLRRKLPEVDFFFPTRDMTQLPRWLAEHGLIDSGINYDKNKTFVDGDDYLKITPRYSNPYQAFLSIQTGCNNFCTYCVVPYARGLERNRPAADILNEARSLSGHGAIEITLLGQTVNSYRAPDGRAAFSLANPYENHFAALLWEMNQLPGIKRIHYTAPHPKSMTDEVIDALTLPKQVNYLHLPVQAGSDEVLRRMNRKYTRADYLSVIQRIKKRVPDIALGTDIIVGFCGETEELFEQTVSLYKEVSFDISYTAMYSPRTGTPAWRSFPNDVSLLEKRRRWRVLHDLMEEIVWQKNQRFVGHAVEVLVASCENGICQGNSREMKLTRFPGTSDLIGRIIPVTVDAAHEWVLDGTIIDGQNLSLL